MPSEEELKREVVRLKGLLDPTWHLKTKRERQARAYQKMLALQNRILVSNKLGVPLPEVSQNFADGVVQAGIKNGSLEYVD